MEDHKNYLVLTDEYQQEEIYFLQTCLRGEGSRFFCVLVREGETSVDYKDGIMMLCTSIEHVVNWLKIISPSFSFLLVKNKKLYELLLPLRIPILILYKDLPSLITVDPERKETELLENYHIHKLTEEFKQIINNNFIKAYTSSVVLSTLIYKLSGEDIPCIYPFIPSSEIIPVNSSRKFISIVGGREEFLLVLLKNIQSPFLLVESRKYPESIYTHIYTRKDGSLILYPSSKLEVLYERSMVVCIIEELDIPHRVSLKMLWESIERKIPVITSDTPELRIINNNPLSLDNPEKWVDKILEIKNGEKLSSELSNKLCNKFYNNTYDLNLWKKEMISLVKTTYQKSKYQNLMIITSFCDQGLGIQARTYLDILSKKMNVYIFSYKPYNSSSAQELQYTEEWKYDKVYYSPYHRDELREEEIKDFVFRYNIGRAVLLENSGVDSLCITRVLQRNYVAVIAVPNIEMFSQADIIRQKPYSLIICNNNFTRDSLERYGIEKTENLGFSLPLIKNVSSSRRGGNKSMNLLSSKNSLKFLCIGGMNAFTRKQVALICKAFNTFIFKWKLQAIQYSENPPLTSATLKEENTLSREYVSPSLTITIQKFYRKEIEKFLLPEISIVNKYLSYKEITDLYQEADVCIQISKREGLGLGFYEALRCGVPVITLDTEPYTEIIKSGINGWLCPCKKVYTDSSLLIPDAVPYEEDLVDIFLQVMSSDLASIKNSTIKDYHERFNYRSFSQRLYKIFK